MYWFGPRLWRRRALRAVDHFAQTAGSPTSYVTVFYGRTRTDADETERASLVLFVLSDDLRALDGFMVVTQRSLVSVSFSERLSLGDKIALAARLRRLDRR